MSSRDDYFARVRPLIGEGLRHNTLSVSRMDLCGRVVELLVSCMLERIVLQGDLAGLADLQRHLQWKNGFVPLQWFVDGISEQHNKPGKLRPSPTLHLGACVAAAGEAARVTWDEGRRTVTMHLVPDDPWSRLVLSGAAARGIRDLLLGRQGFAAAGHEMEYWGNHLWPWARTQTPVSPPEPCPKIAPGAHVMVVGCGSVGSEAVRLLSKDGLRWTLVDGGTVSVFNPYRQWFGTGEIGQPKVKALARRLGPAAPRAVQVNLGRRDLGVLDELLGQDRPDLVILATGTADHGWLARALWQRGVPHLAACAYPQARFYEVSVVLPAEDTPCLHCFRGHLYRGAESAAPMSDELASFLYEELDDEQRRAAYVELVAEPASALETTSIAAVTARCAAEALAPPAQRGRWFRRLLAHGTTCLLGGNVTEEQDGQPAYGLTYPGQVVRLGLDDVVGTGHSRTCDICGRRLEVKHRIELPRADGAQIDGGLLDACDEVNPHV